MRTLNIAIVFVFCGLVFSFSESVLAQDYSFSIYRSYEFPVDQEFSQFTVQEGETFSAMFHLDNNGMDIAAWTYGVCHDDSLVTFISSDPADTATSKNGLPPDFLDVQVHSGGWTQGVVICFLGCAYINPGTTDFLMATATYQCQQSGFGLLEFCDTLGSPSIETVVSVNGFGVVPGQSAGELEILQAGAISFEIVDTSYSGLTGDAFSVNLLLDHESGPAIKGYSIAVCSDPAYISPVSLGYQNTNLSLFNGGAGPDFYDENLTNENWVMATVFDSTGVETISPGTANFLAAVPQYQITNFGVTDLEFCTGFLNAQNPEVRTLIEAVDLIVPTLTNGVITLSQGTGSDPCAVSDAADDCNGNGIADFCEWNFSNDCNGNQILDECELNNGTASDCDGDGLLDLCEMMQGQCFDIQPGGPDGVPDCCQCFFEQEVVCSPRSDGTVLLNISAVSNESIGDVRIFRESIIGEELIASVQAPMGEISFIDLSPPCDCDLTYRVETDCDFVTSGVTGYGATTSCSLTRLLPQSDSNYEFEYSGQEITGVSPIQIGAGTAPTEVVVDFSIRGIDSSPQGGSCGAPTQAFSMAVSHDQRLEFSLAELHPDLIAELGGQSPDYFEYSDGVDNSGIQSQEGWTLGVVYSVVIDPLDFQTIDYTREINESVGVFRVTYTTTAADWLPGDFDSQTDTAVVNLGFVDLNLPSNGQVITNQLVVCGSEIFPVPIPVTLEFLSPNPSLPIFRRGDCFGDGNFNLLDPILMLEHTFLNTDVLCQSACDINDDGVINMVDPIHGLMWMMGMGPPPVGHMLQGANLPSCGQDFTADNLLGDCIYNACE